MHAFFIPSYQKTLLLYEKHRLIALKLKRRTLFYPYEETILC